MENRVIIIRADGIARELGKLIDDGIIVTVDEFSDWPQTVNMDDPFPMSQKRETEFGLKPELIERHPLDLINNREARRGNKKRKSHKPEKRKF